MCAWVAITKMTLPLLGICKHPAMCAWTMHSPTPKHFFPKTFGGAMCRGWQISYWKMLNSLIITGLWQFCSIITNTRGGHSFVCWNNTVPPLGFRVTAEMTKFVFKPCLQIKEQNFTLVGDTLYTGIYNECLLSFTWDKLVTGHVLAKNHIWNKLM